MKMLTIALVLLILIGCSGQPIAEDSVRNSDYQNAVDSMSEFETDERLAHYFEEAVAYAVFPRVIRAGAGFGAAYGSGWVFRKNTVPIGKVQVWQINAGPHIGAQYYQQILFFRNEKSLARFQRGTSEFAGQANLTAITAGISATPSYNNSVAVFTRARGGLMLEGSVGAHRYEYRPLE